MALLAEFRDAVSHVTGVLLNITFFVDDGLLLFCSQSQCPGIIQISELFPEAFPWGYAFFGFTEPSIKQELSCRRIRLDQGQTVFTIAPAFVMPYMTGWTQDVDDPLFLMRFHVPCWAIAHVFGRDAMYWYRLEQSLGRFSVVGTTIKTPERLPKDLVADEKHSWLKGERVYIATTAATDCILGASVAVSYTHLTLPTNREV